MKGLSPPSWCGPLSDKGSPGETLVRKATSLNRKRGTVVGLPNEQTSTISDFGRPTAPGTYLTRSAHPINAIDGQSSVA